jgi:hypothetical protein
MYHDIDTTKVYVRRGTTTKFFVSAIDDEEGVYLELIGSRQIIGPISIENFWVMYKEDKDAR